LKVEKLCRFFYTNTFGDGGEVAVLGIDGFSSVFYYDVLKDIILRK